MFSAAFRNQKLFTCALCVLLVLCGATGGCRRRGHLTRSKTAPRYGGRLVVPVFGSGLTRSNPDPAAPSYELITSQIFETLARRGDTSGEIIEPALAESWETSPDGFVWRFRIRPGVRFHDDECFPGGRGREVTAQDVVFSWQRMIASKKLPVGYQFFGRFIAGAREFHDGQAKQISGLRAIEERTLEVRLVTPFVGFLRAVTWFPTSIVPREAIEHYGDDFPKHPVGTGAFRLIEWDPQRRVVIARHPNYWGRDAEGHALPYLDSIEYLVFADQLTAFQSLINGASHMAPVPGEMVNYVIQQSAANGEIQLRPEYAARGLHLFRYAPTPFSYFICFNLNRSSPLARDARLRYAIGYIVQSRDAQPQRPLLRPVPGVPPLDGKGFFYDAEKAHTLLREAGYPEARGLPKLRLLLVPLVQSANRAAIQEMRSLGLNIEEVMIPLAEMEMALREGDFDIFVGTWEFFYPDAAALLVRFQSDAPPEENMARYRNPQFDELFTKMIGERDEGKRRELISKIEDLLLQDAPLITLAKPASDTRFVVLMRSDVHVMDPQDGRLNLRTVWLNQTAASVGAVRRGMRTM